MADTYVCAGTSYQSTNYGTATSLYVGTSTTSDHSSTYVTFIKFAVPSQTKTIMNAILQLTVSSLPTYDSNMLIIGNPCGQTWGETALTWSTATWARNTSQSTSAAITGVSHNLISLNASMYVAGHVTVAATANVGDVRRVDITKYIKQCAGQSATLTIARRMRNNKYSGNSAGTIPADTLSNGATVGFYSKDASPSSYGPSIVMLYGK